MCSVSDLTDRQAPDLAPGISNRSCSRVHQASYGYITACAKVRDPIIRPKDGRTFTPGTTRSTSVAAPPAKRRASEMDRICAAHVEKFHELFQHLTHRRASWDSVKDRERAKRIRGSCVSHSQRTKRNPWLITGTTMDGKSVKGEPGTSTSHNTIPRTNTRLGATVQQDSQDED